MRELLIESLADSAKTVPFLLFIYFAVEWFERRFGHGIEHRLEKTAQAGPLLGALFGCVPQCGFSVVAASLYARRLISTGTLLAVFLSTSDEAVPVLLSRPDQAGTVALLLGTKLLIAAAAGLLTDRLLPRRPKTGVEPAALPHDETGCCHHKLSGEGGARQVLFHPLIHTAKVFLFIFLVTLGIGGLLAWVGEESLGRVLLKDSALQPLLSALIGLIPNCAASVALAGLFLSGSLSFGSTVAGLCCSGGLGLLVLLKENRSRRDTLRFIGLLLGVSALSGLLIHLLIAKR